MVSDTRLRRPRDWEHPPVERIDLDAMLDALGDPVRLEIIRQLADAGGVFIGPFDVQVTVSTLSHHLKALVGGGLIRVTQSGRFRRCDLRLAEVEARFPGLLPAVLSSAGKPLASQGATA